MALTIRNLVGESGVSGLGTLMPGETRECSPETAAWALTRQGELEVGYSCPFSLNAILLK